MKHDNIAASIGNTPLVRINRMVEPGSAELLVKLESANPGSSVKDRISMAMIETAEREGLLKPGMSIVEPTSGNTGIGLAMVAAAKGYHCVLVMPESMSVERRAVMKMYGAELELSPAAEGMKGAIARAEEIAAEGACYIPSQFDNPANPDVHRRTTGPEIIADLDDQKLDAFVAGVGTGGTISGAGGVLKAKYGCLLVAVEPEDSPVISGGPPGPHPIQGIGAGFIPKNLNVDLVDRVIRVKNGDAFATGRRLAREEGILAGISSGANLWAALEIARELGPDKTVVTIVCDTGERYLSTALFED